MKSLIITIILLISTNAIAASPCWIEVDKDNNQMVCWQRLIHWQENGELKVKRQIYCDALPDLLEDAKINPDNRAYTCGKGE